jgi:lysophospholipase L1-like esterase
MYVHRTGTHRHRFSLRWTSCVRTMQRTVWLLIMLVWPLASALCQKPQDSNADRYRSEIELFKNFDARNTIPSDAILFIGSSSISHWETSKAFPEYPVINRGLGGSVFPDLLYYYDDIVKKYQPAVVVIYCDNDVLYGKSPESVLQHFKELSGKITKDFPRAEIVFLSMKPTPPMDADMWKTLQATNKMFKAFADDHKNIHYVDVATSMLGNDGHVKPGIFLSDDEHLNPEGYEKIWNPIVKKQLSKLYNRTGVPARGR